MADIFIKLQWVRRLLLAKSYIVLADSKSVIVIRGIHSPPTFTEVLHLQTQQASLFEYRNMLDELIEEHSQKIEQLMEGDAGGHEKKTT